MVATIGRFASPVPGPVVGNMPPAMANLGGQFRSWVEQNPQTVSNLSAGLLSGGTFRDSLARASATIGPSMAADKLERDRQAKIASLKKWVEAQQAAGKVIPPATLEAISANSDIAAALLTKSAVNDFGLGDPTERYKVVGDRVFDMETREYIAPPAGMAGSMFGSSVEGRSLEYLINNGILTPQQAAEVGAGKTVMGADGLPYFFTPQQLMDSQGGGITPAGTSPPVNTGAPAPAPNGNSLITPAPVATTVTGPKPLFDPNKAKDTDTQRNDRAKAAKAVTALNTQLDRFQQIVDQQGISVLPGAGRDQLQTVRLGIQLQLKELFNLGVLNGPDLSLMEKMLYDPAIDVSKEGGLAQLPGQLATAALGDAANRARSNIAEIKRMMDGIIAAQSASPAPAAGTAAGAPAPGGNEGADNAPTATGPNGEKLILRNGAWVPK